MNHQHFYQCIFWLYYTRGLLQAKLKHHNDAIGSFTASIDTKNYAQVLMGNLELAKEESYKLLEKDKDWKKFAPSETK